MRLTRRTFLFASGVLAGGGKLFAASKTPSLPTVAPSPSYQLVCAPPPTPRDTIMPYLTAGEQRQLRGIRSAQCYQNRMRRAGKPVQSVDYSAQLINLGIKAHQRCYGEGDFADNY